MTKLFIPVQINRRVDQCLYEYFQGTYSRNFLQQCISEGRLLAGDKPITKPAYKAKIAGTLTFLLPEPESTELESSDINVDILFQDEDLAVILKPYDMTVHPGAGRKQDTLVNALLGKVPLAETDDPWRPGIVHRLDRETEGLLVIAKNRHAHWKLSRLFAERQVKKTYHAFLSSVPTQSEAEIEGYIRRDPKNRKLMKFESHSTAGSKLAQLSYRSLSGKLVEVDLKTGRTHQIRATFKALRNPVLGDSLYGRKIERGLCLFAVQLEFQHPNTGKLLSFQMPTSSRYQAALKSFG